MLKTPCTSPRPTFKETGSISGPQNRDSHAVGLNLAQSGCRRYVHAASQPLCCQAMFPARSWQTLPRWGQVRTLHWATVSRLARQVYEAHKQCIDA